MPGKNRRPEWFEIEPEGMPSGNGCARHPAEGMPRATGPSLRHDPARRQFLGGAAAALAFSAGLGVWPRFAAGQSAQEPVLLRNFRFFDGQRPVMQEGRDLLVRDGRIAGLPRAGEGPADVSVVDCGGRSLVPGLIDCHVHMTIAAINELVAMTGDPAFFHLVSGREAGAMLQRGFTTVRDVGGPVFGLKMAIDRGVLDGPRIFPSGAALSQTSGHGDFRMLHELPRMPSTPANRVEVEGINVIADGVPEVLRRTREQLMKGASQIKIMAGGGVSSLYDPLDTLQYTPEEIRAAVQAAADWGTYVCAHVYMPEGIRRCIEAGVRSIEHGQLADEESVRRMAGEGVWWSIQPFFADEDSNPKSDPRAVAKQNEVAEGTARALELGRKHKVKMAFGTDILFNPQGTTSQGRQLAKFARFMPPLEALGLATGSAGELLALSGERAPYDGRLGVIADGALADLLVVDADPAASPDWLDDPARTLRLIMKGGKIYKNRL